MRIKGKYPTIEAIISLCEKQNISYKKEWLPIVDCIIEKLYEKFGNDIKFRVHQEYDPEYGGYENMIWLIAYTSQSVEYSLKCLDEIDMFMYSFESKCPDFNEFRCWFMYDVEYITGEKDD